MKQDQCTKGTHTTCIIEGCTRKGHIKGEGRSEVFRRGYCVHHYYRFKTHGDPNINKKGSGRLARAKEHPLYGSWFGMVQRASNPKNQDYKYYQARGITLCDRWVGLDGFDNFCNDMGPKPTPKHSIDRIDNDGNYCPENCRWANKHQQMCNTRKVDKSHPGVRYNSKKGVWVAGIKIDRKQYPLGEFANVQDAIKARKSAEQHHKIVI